ncbi:MAG: DUF3299 domain-containing protein, partial [Planctomycetota bacterium]
APHQDAPQPAARDRGAPAPAGEPTAAVPPGPGADGAEIEIDFPLLDGVRSLDLIDPYRVFPEHLAALDGRRVRIAGFMAPFDSLDSMRRCMVVPSYVGCTFCSPPALNQVVFVEQGDLDGGAFPFVESVAVFSGTFRLSLPESDHGGSREGFIYTLEDATVEAVDGAARVAAPGHSTSPHQAGSQEVTSVTAAELVAQVAEAVGLAPLRPIEIELVEAERFRALVEDGVRASYPEATHGLRAGAFELLGLLPEGADWLESATEFELSRRVAIASGSEPCVLVFDSAPDRHPYTRLDIVGEIALLLARQHGALPGRTDDASATSDDALRARDCVEQGYRAMAIRRFATAQGLPPGPAVPVEIVRRSRTPDFDLWQSMTRFCGYFFVRALIGDAGPLTDLAEELDALPRTTMEIFRPRWYQDPERWRPDPVPADFADDWLDIPPDLTDVLGVGGLFPFLRRWYAMEETLGYVSGWTGDRWAYWRLPDERSKLLLEVRWRDEEAALLFRDTIPDGAGWSLEPHEDGSDRVRLSRAR